ncbi:MAG: DUF1810 domain-containing protein [Lentimicrobium sp.]|nr:DUF1810 domain-containing protein [Lentimicrobium sp.]
METDLSRFIEAQKFAYPTALSEIKVGKKRNHWMWFIFPQILGLGLSEMSVRYAIKNIDEARAYLNHEILGNRLREITGVLLNLKTSDAREVFGYPDNLKLRSCMTLFAQIDEKDGIFQQVLDKYFFGAPDNTTLRLIQRN